MPPRRKPATATATPAEDTMAPEHPNENDNTPTAPPAAPAAAVTDSDTMPDTAPLNEVSSTSAPAPTTGHRKFKPRGIRRPQAERDEIARRENERRAAEDEQARLLRASRPGRGGMRRPRGGQMRPGEGPRVAHEDDGGLGIFTAGPRSSRPRPTTQRLFEDSVPRASKKTTGGKASAGNTGAPLPSHPESSTKQAPVKRMNIDMLAVVEISSDEDEPESRQNGSRPLFPKGILRIEHKDKPVEMPTTAQLEAREDAEESDVDSEHAYRLDDGDTVMKDDAKVWTGAATTSKVKKEPQSPELGRAFPAIKTGEGDVVRTDVGKIDQSTRTSGHRAVARDAEDIRRLENLKYQYDLFSPRQDEKQDSDLKAFDAGNVFLFQFPPIMPPLQLADPPKIKPEPRDDDDDNDVVMTNGQENAIDLTNDAADRPPDISTNAIKSRLNLEDISQKQGGLAGRLIVRKSGKMEIDYGGMIFDVESGIPVDFARTAVLTTMDDGKHGTEDKGFQGLACGMGLVREKFVAVPRWSEEEAWIVDPSDLPPNGMGAG